jgi:hypothetical protein
MLLLFESMPRMTRRTVDITPGAGLRRAGRALLGAALLTIMLPVLWLIGGIVLLAFFGAAVLVLTALAARQWLRRGMRRSPASMP